MPRTSVQLFEDQFVVNAAADLQLANVVANDELETLRVAIHLAASIIDQVDPLLERHLKMVADPFDRHALVKIVGIDSDPE